ncbi:MaoC family dehydratase [Mesorhizobium abyssinicae]|uniref:MaoC family dehydratase n=1 Tax=Mesorhizobium abyssinicae TaxID=1209958 RepID=UPI003399FCD3
MNPRQFDGIDDLAKAVGTHLGYSPWRVVSQDRINKFADATDDHQWIHTDEDRAKTGPFGTTIAHGFLTVALTTPMVAEIFEVNNLAMELNYGLEKLRFPSVVPVGGRVRAGAELVALERKEDHARIITRVVVEVEGQDKPACVAEFVALLFP